MRITLDIFDNKMGSHLIALLKSLSYVKIEEVSEEETALIKDIKSSIKEINQIKSGKKKGRNFEDFLNEL